MSRNKHRKGNAFPLTTSGATKVAKSSRVSKGELKQGGSKKEGVSQADMEAAITAAKIGGKAGSKGGKKSGGTTGIIPIPSRGGTVTKYLPMVWAMTATSTPTQTTATSTRRLLARGHCKGVRAAWH